MVLLVERLGHSLKLFSSKLDHHHHHHHSNDLSASLQAFRSDVSNCLNQLPFNSILRSDFLSLMEIQQLMELVGEINKAFAKLAMEIDYPMSKWEITPIEEYLEYSLNLLELLNSISSSLSQISQSRVSLSHALSLVDKSPLSAIKHLKPIQPKKCLRKDFKEEEEENRKKSKEIVGEHEHGKEVWVVEEALMVMKRIGLWVCGVILSGLYSDIKKPYVVDCGSEGFVECMLMGSGGVWEWKMGNGNLLKEVKEVNDAVEEFLVEKNAEAEAKKELLERRLEMLEKLVEGVDKDSNRLFSEVLAARNKLLDSFSFTHKNH